MLLYLTALYLVVQAEIEHFVNPDDKSHPKFKEVADLAPLLYSRYRGEKKEAWGRGVYGCME